MDLTTARHALGLADPAVLREVIEAVARGDAATALRRTAAAFDAGADSRQVVRELARLVRATTLIGIGYREGVELDKDDLECCERLSQLREAGFWVDGLELLNATDRELRQPVDARLQIEYCLLRLAQPSSNSPGLVQAAAAQALQPAAPVLAPEPVQVLVEEPNAIPPIAEPAIPAAPAPIEASPDQQGDATEPLEPAVATAAVPGPLGRLSDVAAWTQVWSQLVDALGERDSMLAGVLRDCRPLEASADKLVIGAPYKFHLERLSDTSKHAALVEAVVQVGGPALVEAQFCGDASPPVKPSLTQSQTSRAVLETFKGSRITSSRLRDDIHDVGKPQQ